MYSAHEAQEMLANMREMSKSVRQAQSERLQLQQVCLFNNNLTIMRWKSVCLSAPSSAFPVAWSRTPTVAFESLGLRYVPPPVHTGSLRGWGISFLVFFPHWFCQASQLSALCTVVLHGGKLPPIGRGASSNNTNNSNNNKWTFMYLCSTLSFQEISNVLDVL